MRKVQINVHFLALRCNTEITDDDIYMTFLVINGTKGDILL